MPEWLASSRKADLTFLSSISFAKNKKKGSTTQKLFVIKMTDRKKLAHLLRSFSAFDRADGEAESGSTRDVWNVHVVVEPFVPPVRKITPELTRPATLTSQSLVEKPRAQLLYYLGLEQGTRWVLTLSHNCSPPWYIPVLT